MLQNAFSSLVCCGSGCWRGSVTKMFLLESIVDYYFGRLFVKKGTPGIPEQQRSGRAGKGWKFADGRTTSIALDEKLPPRWHYLHWMQLHFDRMHCVWKGPYFKDRVPIDTCLTFWVAIFILRSLFLVFWVNFRKWCQFSLHVFRNFNYCL